jgi:hypothetical protein
MMERKCNKDSFHPLATIHHRKASKQIHNNTTKNYTEFKKNKSIYTRSVTHDSTISNGRGKSRPKKIENPLLLS